MKYMNETPLITWPKVDAPTYFQIVGDRVEITRPDCPICRIPLADILNFAEDHNEAVKDINDTERSSVAEDAELTSSPIYPGQNPTELPARECGLPPRWIASSSFS
jgi:hypothetical protein